MTRYDAESFSAGQETGTRVAACLARLAALELVDGARWWNRRRLRAMARALVAQADEMEAEVEEQHAKGRDAALAVAPRAAGAGVNRV